ncbi:twin-arginine translocation signal domain-containing protein [Raoultibacter timonensis]|uniref:twin-arginine translocation signal domain-containing protein n=1 Tax=Raoultibacter timonensis TaxID=1907662 RepID=UPI000C8235A5
MGIETKSGISRRSFLGLAGIAGVGAVTGLAGCSPQQNGSGSNGSAAEHAPLDRRSRHRPAEGRGRRDQPWRAHQRARTLRVLQVRHGRVEGVDQRIRRNAFLPRSDHGGVARFDGYRRYREVRQAAPLHAHGAAHVPRGPRARHASREGAQRGALRVHSEQGPRHHIQAQARQARARGRNRRPCNWCHL